MARRAAQRAASAGPAVSFTPLPTPILRRGTRKGSWQSQRGGNGCRGCRGCIQSPRQKAVRGLIRGRQSCGWLSRQSHAPRWRCAGASILEGLEFSPPSVQTKTCSCPSFVVRFCCLSSVFDAVPPHCSTLLHDGSATTSTITREATPQILHLRSCLRIATPGQTDRERDITLEPDPTANEEQVAKKRVIITHRETQPEQHQPKPPKCSAKRRP